VLFQNWGSILDPLGEAVKRAHGPGEPSALLGQIGLMAEPSLTLAYGEPSRIVLANTSEGGLLGRGLASILSVPSLVSVQQLLGDAVEGDEASPVEEPSR
jgi:hypothetical protein